MARDDLHFRLRIPDDLKQRIAEAAENNRRSMTAEIVARLESSFNFWQNLKLPAQILERLEHTHDEQLDGIAAEASELLTDFLNEALPQRHDKNQLDMIDVGATMRQLGELGAIRDDAERREAVEQANRDLESSGSGLRFYLTNSEKSGREIVGLNWVSEREAFTDWLLDGIEETSRKKLAAANKKPAGEGG